MAQRMESEVHSDYFFIHSVHPPFSAGRLNLPPNFQKKGGLDRTSTLRGELLEKKGVTFFRGEGGCNFTKKSQLKSEIFNDKKSL